MTNFLEVAAWVNKNAGIIAVGNTMVLAVLGFLFNRSQERLKAHLNAKFHAHTVQYEREFEIIGNLWMAAVDYRNAAIDLNPLLTPSILEGVERSETDETKEKLIRCSKALHTLYSVIDKHRPFFPQGIRDILEYFIKIACQEAAFTERRWRNRENVDSSDYESSSMRRKLIEEKIDELEKEIRKYNDSLK